MELMPLSAAVLATLVSCALSPSIEGSFLFPFPALAVESAPSAPGASSEAAPSARDDGTHASGSALVIAATAADDLGPSSDPPWNPPRPTPRRRTWEQVVLLPQRIVTLPLTAIGMATDRTLTFLDDRSIPARLVNVSRELPRRYGAGLGVASLGDRTGIGVKLNARATFLPGRFRNSMTITHSATTEHYHDTEMRLFGKPFGLEYRYQWRPQERFNGIGMDAREVDLAGYAVHVEHLRTNLGIYWNKGEAGSDDSRTQLVTWLGPRSVVTLDGREPGTTSVRSRFPEIVSSTLGRTYEQMTYGIRFTSDWRMGRPRWWEGWRVLIESERFDRPWGGLAFKTERGGTQFTRTTIEMEGASSFGREPRTIRFLGRLEDRGVNAGAERMEIFDLAALGGRAGLRGFEPGRFHDFDLFLGRVSYLFTLVRRIELDLHVETGAVFSNVWKNSRLDQFEQSAGLAIRGRTPAQKMAGAFGFDFCREGIRIRYTVGNPDR
jgi:hypothetical protein